MVVPGAAPVATVEPPLSQGIAHHLWEQLMTGADFWDVVQKPFRAHEVTRAQLAALIDRGLQETRGSYRALVRLFNLPSSDYKRFHAFLRIQTIVGSFVPDSALVPFSVVADEVVDRPTQSDWCRSSSRR